MVGIFMVLTVVAVAMPQDNNKRGARTGNERNAPRPNSGNGNKAENTGQGNNPKANSRNTNGGNAKKDSLTTRLDEILQIADEEIPDSLLHPRWGIQRTTPITYDDLKQNPADLKRPDNLEQKVEYNDSLDTYIFGNKMGGTYINTPIMMSLDDYLKYVGHQQRADYYRSKNSEIFEQKGKEKFDFTDMHFDLGPAEKIFGPGGVRIKTQGTAELKFGATIKNIDNPSLPIRNRKTTSIDFDEKINLNMTGKVGDKVNMSLNYNTDATFNFDQQNLKLKYDGKEDEIIKLLEGGNVSLPSNSSLIQGASSLFGIRTDLQFGKLKLQTVLSQKKSNSSSVSTKGGVQYTPFEIDAANYEENRHFFLDTYFRDHYDAAMSKLPNLMTGINITRVEVWVTNKSGATTNTRNLIAVSELGDATTKNWTLNTVSGSNPSNGATREYSAIKENLPDNIDEVEKQMANVRNSKGEVIVGGQDYEKIERARLLNSSEYTLNSALGYISLKTTLQSDQILAVAYEYTYGGQTYYVGDLTTSKSTTDEAENASSRPLIVRALKNTANTPTQPNWNLMMKNVYYLASSVEKSKFRLDVKFQSDTTGVYLTYLPEAETKSTPLIKLMGADRLDNNNKAHSNGYFDFVEGYTVSNGRVFFPSAEPFGRSLKRQIMAKGVSEAIANKYAYTELYDSTKTIAKQIAEKDKFILQGQFKGTSANVISLGAYNVPRGSVVVTAGGVTLTEGSDYSVDYSAGEVTILNQSILDAGTNVTATCESNTDYGQQRKTMMGFNWEYDFSKDFQLSGTLQHLSEQSLTTKVSMGAEPLNNTIWGLNLNWKKESQWLTNVLDKLPFLHLTAPSSIQISAEFAQLIAGQASGTQDNASYIDDFENTKNTISDIINPSSWIISSVPSNPLFPEYSDKTTLRSGYNRALMAWYNIDPLFTRRSSSLTPSYIKDKTDILSNHYVREVYVSELFPNRDQSSYNGATNTLSILNMAYYPQERGPYNFSTDLDQNGNLNHPEQHWGGMMRKLDTSDFEAANVEYLEFWLMDPFLTGKNGYSSTTDMGGDLYIDLGEVSEDILRDGKKFYESGLPVDGSTTYTTTQWGKIPTQSAVTYAFSTQSGTRQMQDLGFNGLNDEEEKTFESYSTFMNYVSANCNEAARAKIEKDPAADNYKYFRSSDYDAAQTPILECYKYINNPQGNSPDSEQRTESYDTSYKTTPDVEDINQDYTLNEYERYYEYKVRITPESLSQVGNNYIVDKREASPSLRNGDKDKVTWYQFRIPLKEIEGRTKVGSISDFSSIRFMRMYLTNCKKPLVLRFGTLDLVRGEWRTYEQNINPSAPNTGTMEVSAVNIEENNDKTPVNYVLPPGISRVVDPSQPQLVENNEQALAMTLKNMSKGDAKCVYKNTTLDLRNYKRLQMFVHANALEQNVTNLQDNQLALFVRLGSDYKSNYYEYQIPLKLTPAGHYDTYSSQGCQAVWPEDNMLNIDLSVFTALKKERNVKKGQGDPSAAYNLVYSSYDDNNPQNMVSIIGNPSLGEVKTLIIGVRNLASDAKSGEVWVNEMRLKDSNNEGGWAAQGNMNLQLSDLGTVNLAGKYTSHGFGGLEQGISQRSTDDYSTYSATANIEVGKFFPDKAKVSAPIYYSVTKENTSPKYNPLDTDMTLKDALDATANKHERDSIENIAVTKTLTTNFSVSNVRVGIATKGHPMPYDPANFSFSYSHNHSHKQGETTVYENEDNWRGAINYSWTPNYKSFEPFKKLKSKSKYLDILKKFGLNWLPQSVAFNTEMTRTYYELQERDMESMENSSLPLTFYSTFFWNRDFNLRWDLTKNLHFTFQSATHAEVEEPYTPLNKDLYPDHYEAWKDSVWTSIKHMGTPLEYSQNVSASYKLPLNLIPIFDWMTADGSYSSTYKWNRGTELDDGSALINNIAMNRTYSLNGQFSMEKLYNHVPFLKKANERFSKSNNNSKKDTKKRDNKDNKNNKNDKNNKENKDDKNDPKAQLPLNKNTFSKEVQLFPDSMIEVAHNKKSKRLIITAKDEKGKPVKIRFKKKDDNKIMVSLKGDSAIKVKLNVTKLPDLDEKKWYQLAQSAARFMMMIRNVSFTYRNTYSLGVPGFLPSVGNVFGQQRNDGLFSPGLDFAFGFVGDDYVDRAKERGWLLCNDSVATPATTSRTEDLQLRMTLEPFRNFKIDLNASHTMTRNKRVQYMYSGNPTTETGLFNMTTLSLGTAFESMGNASNGFHSATFEKFCNSLSEFQELATAAYVSKYGGNPFSIGSAIYDGKTPVSKYSSDVMVPAFLNAYTLNGGKSLSLFPALTKVLPNWSLKYSGLGQLSWFRDKFKSVNISHAYKSVFSIGSYSSYASFLAAEGVPGFITSSGDANALIPNSMYDISQVSINEAFSPLLGVDVTLQNNMTLKLEYKTTRTINLSMTSVQLTEQTSKDWVFGMGYKIQDFNIFGGGNRHKIKGGNKKKGAGDNDNNNLNAKNNTKSSSTSKKNSISHDMNLRLDLSYRRQAAINRDIATMTSTATNGNNAFKLSFTADYTLSRLVTMSFYLDRQTNTPLLSNNSYPTTTQDFGLSLKFSLTR